MKQLIILTVLASLFVFGACKKEGETKKDSSTTTATTTTNDSQTGISEDNADTEADKILKDLDGI